MMKDITLTPEFRLQVHKLLMLMAEAKCVRERVNEVIALLLEEHPLYDRNDQQITEPGRTWTCRDETAIKEHWDMLDERLREIGIKPYYMEKDVCPALVAEYEQTKAEWKLFHLAEPLLGVESGKSMNNLLLSMGGIEKRQEVLDLFIKLVLSLEKEGK